MTSRRPFTAETTRRWRLPRFASAVREQWQRGSLHVTLGRMTFADWAALMAAHDDKHQDQLERALEGRA